MAVYEGRRTIDGVIVTKDGEPMVAPPMQGKFLPVDGFEWGYEGDASLLLAQALLLDHLGDEERVNALSDTFMRGTIAALENEWQLDSAAIDAAIGVE